MRGASLFQKTATFHKKVSKENPDAILQSTRKQRNLVRAASTKQVFWVACIFKNRSENDPENGGAGVTFTIIVASFVYRDADS